MSHLRIHDAAAADDDGYFVSVYVIGSAAINVCSHCSSYPVCVSVPPAMTLTTYNTLRLRAKLIGAVYCSQSSLCVCVFVGLFVGLLPR